MSGYELAAVFLRFQLVSDVLFHLTDVMPASRMYQLTSRRKHWPVTLTEHHRCKVRPVRVHHSRDSSPVLVTQLSVLVLRKTGASSIMRSFVLIYLLLSYFFT